MLAAIGVPRAVALGAIRLSLGRTTTSEEVGAVNRLYAFAHRIGEAKKRFKRAHPQVYRYGRIAIALALLAWLLAPLM